MSVERSFPIEDPALDIPWGISEPGFLALVGTTEMTRVTPGHYRLRCRVLGGLEHELHFHFRPERTTAKKLAEIELHRPLRRHRARQFNDLQDRLERLLGPAQRMPHPLLEASAQWRTGKLTVTHENYVTGGAEFEKVRFTYVGR